jgi:hypothetical protein
MRQLSEIHSVDREMVHLAVQRSEESGDWVCLIEGGGVCLGNALPEYAAGEAWIRNMFRRLFPAHHCDLGCIALPEAEFLAQEEVLSRLAG